MFRRLLNWILPPVDFTVRFKEEDVMKRIVCTCSCGGFSWSMDFEDGKEEFTLHEGIADDCPTCHVSHRKPKPFVRDRNVPVMHKDEDTTDFDAFMARRKEQGRQQGRKKRGAR